MGTEFFRPRGGSAVKPSTATNLSARAFGAPAYTGRMAGGMAGKDVAAAKALSQNVLKPGLKTAASNAPGPKKV